MNLTSAGGSGIWDTSSPFWYNGSSNMAWNNSGQVFGTPDSASFANPAGTVTLGAPIIGNSVSFVNSSYTIDLNGFNLNLTGSITGHNSNTITNLTGTPATLTVTTISGGGPTLAGNLNVTKEGAVGWTPSIAHSFTGLLTLKGGTTTITNNSFLGGPTASLRLQDTAGLTLNASATFTRNIELVGTTTAITPGNQTVLLDGDITGSGSFRQTGTQGRITLAGNNSYSGATAMVSAGSTLVAASNNAFGNTPTISIPFSSNTLGFQGNIAVAGTPIVTVNGAGSAASGSLHNFSDDNSFGGEIRLTAAATFGSDSGTLHLTGVIPGDPAGSSYGSGSRTFTKIGPGAIELVNGNNSYRGETVVRNGTLLVGANAPHGNGGTTQNVGALGNRSATDAGRFVRLGDSGTAATNDLALLISGPFEIERPINVLNNNANGTTTIGGTNTSGIASFTGAIALQRNLIVSSATGGTVEFRADTSNPFGQALGAGIISGAFGVSIEGGGKVVYSTSNPYTGTTNVNDGTLLVNGTLSATNAQVIVNDGGTLGGSGTIGTTTATVTIQGGGTLAPGASVGTLNIGTAGTGNNVVFGGTAGNHAIYHVEIDGLTDDSDLLVVNGNLDLSGAFDELNVSILGPPPTSKTHIIATYTGTLSGIFDFVPTGYSVNYGTGVNSFISLSVGAIPEPSSLLLLAFGAVFVARRRPVRSCQKGKARRPSVH